MNPHNIYTIATHLEAKPKKTALRNSDKQHKTKMMTKPYREWAHTLKGSYNDEVQGPMRKE